MKVAAVIAFSAAMLAAAQTQTAVVQSHAPAVTGKQISAAAAPVLGYMVGPGAAELRPIVTTSARVKLGDALTVPSESKRLYLPPRQQYSLVESNTESPLSVWAFRNAERVPIYGAMAHPDLIRFSPRGDAAVLYSQAAEKLQVVRHLPAQALVSQVNLSGSATLINAAITDDGDLLVVELSDGRILSSLKGGDWTALLVESAPTAWTFIPKTHNLAVSDPLQQQIVLLTNSEGQWGAPRVVAQEVEADELAASVSGEELAAASRNAGKIWTIDLASGAVTPRPAVGQAGPLYCLRDGFTFVVSTMPGLSLVNVRPIADESKAGELRE